MKTKLILDSLNCPTNSFSVLTTNARWIAEAKTWKSGASRARVVRTYLLNAGLPSALAWQLIDQLDTAVKFAEQGIAL